MAKKYIYVLVFVFLCSCANSTEPDIVLKPRKPDVVSKHATYQEYYSYDKVTGKWVWKEDLKKLQKQRAMKKLADANRAKMKKPAPVVVPKTKKPKKTEEEVADSNKPTCYYERPLTPPTPTPSTPPTPQIKDVITPKIPTFSPTPPPPTPSIVPYAPPTPPTPPQKPVEKPSFFERIKEKVKSWYHKIF